MKISYFINQYPMVSHSFIRREILALEQKGISVQRIALRGWDIPSINDEDEIEKKKTTYILKEDLISLIFSMFKIMVSSPFKYLLTLKLLFIINHKSDRSFPHHFISLIEACYVLPILKQYGSEHIHAHFGTNSTEVIMLANSLGGPHYSFTVHGPEEFDKPNALHLAEKIQYSKFVIAISSFGRSQLFRWIDKSQWNKVKVVHCGLEKNFYTIPRVPIPSSPRLVCIGRLCEQKGQLLLVEACRILDKKSIDFELILAGDGELRNEIEYLIEKYQLQKKIKITGWVNSEQVRNELLVSKGMILPSFAEGLPVVIMESMSLYRPVLTTYIAGIPELIQHKENGFLFHAGDIDSITKAIEDFLCVDNSELEKIASRGYLQVTKRHNIETETDKLVEFFKVAITDKS